MVRNIDIPGLLGLTAVLTLAACSSSSTTLAHGSGTGGSTTSPGTGTGGSSSNAGTGSIGGAKNTGGTTSGSTQVVVSPCTTPLTPCGGDITGTWTITQACIQGDLAQYYNDEMVSNYTSACSNTFRSATLASSGTITYASGNLTSNVTLTISEDIVMTPACFAAIAGQAVTVNAAYCSSYADSLENQNLGSMATCAYDGANCNCAYTILSTGGSDTYTTSGTLITWSSGATSGYCVQGNTLSERDPVASNVTMSFTATKL